MDFGTAKVEQQITYLDPYTCYLVSPTHSWRMAYRTSELGAEKVRKLLSTHPELVEADGKADPAKRVAIGKFLLDAGWPADAKRELEKLRAEFTGEMDKEAKSQVDQLGREIDLAAAENLAAEAEKAVAAGRYKAADAVLQKFSDKNADPRTTDRVTKLLATVRTNTERYDAARRLLTGVIDEVSGKGRRPADAAGPRTATPDPRLIAAARTVLAELHPDTAGRAEFFVGMAGQAERDRQQNRAPTKRPDELLATAVSSWVKGKNGFSAAPDAALRAWDARLMVLEYQRTGNLNERKKLLSTYRKQTGALSLDELVQVVSLLPPAEPDDLAVRSGQLVPAGGAVPEGVYRRSLGVPNRARPMDYLVRLPDEYQHGRAYPVLLVLTQPDLAPENLLGGLSAEADRNGYILVAPDWVNGTTGPYDYDGEQHVAVTAVLRDVVRHYSVDNDRVFMFGFGEGANMAMDVGMSHPDLFAGVIPWDATPRWTNMFSHYWKNAQRLPFYAVTGELAGRTVEFTRAVFNQWMPKGFPALFTVYKGRNFEWFPAEVPVMFDWMGRKRRINGAAALNLGAGGPQEYWQTMRPTDDRFYWLGAEELSNVHRLDLAAPGRGATPAWLTGDIVAGNKIRVRSGGVKRLAVWLSRDMVDWTKPVTVEHNGYVPHYFKPQKLEPDVDVLMEDFHLRGDRRMLFLYKVELKGI